MADGNPTLATFVINLAGSPARLAAMETQFQRLGRSFVRIAAVDGRGFAPGDVPSYDERAALAYMGRRVLGGELGCFLSHMKAARALLDSDCDAALVLEDDAILSDSVFPLLDQVLPWLAGAADRDWKLINLGYAPTRVVTPLRGFTAAGSTFELCRAHYFPMGAFALCWSRSGAEAFLDRCGTIRSPVDNLYRDWLSHDGGGLAFRPPPVDVHRGASDIETGDARQRHGRHWTYGLKKQRRMWQAKLWALRRRRLTRNGPD